MKFLKYLFALTACAIVLSCTSDDDSNTQENLEGQTGNVILKFDNGVGDQDFIFGTSYNKSNQESFKISTLKYIISNVRLTDADGNDFIYPTEENAFIVNEANGNNAGEIFINLNNIDAANYVSVTFGVGIDQERFALGADGQGDFLDYASDEGMMWSWATGYRFIRLDGTYSTTSITDDALNIHMGSVGTSLDNYREVTLPLPNTILVRENKTPQIHIKADILKIFDGINIADGYNQVHTDATTTPVIAGNIQSMFSVHHVHNE